MNSDLPEMITASELAEWVYSREEWRKRRLGLSAPDQGMPGEADGNTAKLLTGLSVAVLLMMLIREGKGMFGHHLRAHASSWQNREHERRAHRQDSQLRG